MVAMERTQSGVLRSCSECKSAILRGHQAFGHLHAITPNARGSFLLLDTRTEKLLAVQAL